ncbi:type I 3-dehydroquinate dehydratase [Staphylococcus pettenkoferi]|uniref:3-dehydroquinate dehydratase n=1 Tax=Staphylococcus pettenkoferi TaxID=170573 RepID=A0A9Q4D6I0_9STAP|nr:type I 3-dehydroquinate dehydratase [Staphylococcus pettenkoferi]MCY1568759.1 type I 3-dehydroquinate dehydratase [Staphylococcus pettenkoferi]MCY1577133.1 type I 3-dehydroquinate dehydratase [Staphylococcus pettenkoferi]MCY1595518.1 type I 3-dehydroquinate dehydratase [Staphylococcus pettenkoferi]MCY1617565.1 type I 3-dehydroquinate dehydratase [Staphylococcus pettenkoferi]
MQEVQIAVTIAPDYQLDSKMIQQLQHYQADFDIVELRIDQWPEFDVEVYKRIIETLRDVVPGKEILVTYRTSHQGGKGNASETEYGQIIRAIAKQQPNYIDIEFDEHASPQDVQALVNEAHNQRVKVIISHHNFTETPNLETLRFLYYKMHQCGGDMLKVAVMPRTPEDVLTLMSAMHQTSTTVSEQVIGIAMGDLGKVSRLATGVFGGSISYGCLEAPQAPGQVQVKDLRRALRDYC